MAKIYFKRIMAGIMTIEEVPERWRSAVQALLNEVEPVEEPEEPAQE